MDWQFLALSTAGFACFLFGLTRNHDRQPWARWVVIAGVFLVAVAFTATGQSDGANG